MLKATIFLNIADSQIEVPYLEAVHIFNNLEQETIRDHIYLTKTENINI